MGKKIKITEDQLKRIIGQNVNENDEMGEIQEESPNQMSRELLALKVGKKFGDLFPDNKNDEEFVDYFLIMLKYSIMDKSSNDKEEEDGEEEMPIPPSEEETQNNQVYESLKQNFNRFI